MEIDNGFRDDSKPPRRFYLNRMVDQTGVSRTGRVLEGVLWQDGSVTVRWRPPMTSLAVYPDFTVFKAIHVDCHPSCSEVIWLDPIHQAPADFRLPTPHGEYRPVVDDDGIPLDPQPKEALRPLSPPYTAEENAIIAGWRRDAQQPRSSMGRPRF